MFTLMIVESLFNWLDTFSALLCGVGFMLLWHLTGTRGTNIVTAKHRTLTLVLAIVLMLNSLFGLLREMTWLFEVGVGLTGLLTAVVLYPAWFIFLGQVRVADLSFISMANDMSSPSSSSSTSTSTSTSTSSSSSCYMAALLVRQGLGKVDSLGKTMGLMGNYAGSNDANPAAANAGVEPGTAPPV